MPFSPLRPNSNQIITLWEREIGVLEYGRKALWRRLKLKETGIDGLLLQWIYERLQVFWRMRNGWNAENFYLFLTVNGRQTRHKKLEKKTPQTECQWGRRQEKGWNWRIVNSIPLGHYRRRCRWWWQKLYLNTLQAVRQYF